MRARDEVRQQRRVAGVDDVDPEHANGQREYIRAAAAVLAAVPHAQASNTGRDRAANHEPASPPPARRAAVRNVAHDGRDELGHAGARQHEAQHHRMSVRVEERRLRRQDDLGRACTRLVKVCTRAARRPQSAGCERAGWLTMPSVDTTRQYANANELRATRKRSVGARSLVSFAWSLVSFAWVSGTYCATLEACRDIRFL